MGMFDDLIPAAPASGDTGAGGMFDDLIPKESAKPKLDFSQPTEKIREQIAALPEDQRKAAMDAWADDYVAKEQKGTGVGRTVDDAVRSVARGTLVGSFLDEANALTSAGAHAIGIGGAPYDEAVAYQRARDRAYDKASPAASTVGKLVGAFGGVGAGLKAAQAGTGVAQKAIGTALAGPVRALTPANTMLGNVAKGAAFGAGAGAVHGFGAGEGGVDERVEKAGEGAAVGGVLGGALPPVVSGIGSGVGWTAEKLSPQLARVGGNISALRDRLAIRASAGDNNPVVSRGADAAADQIIANQLARANVGVPQLRQRFAEADRALEMGPNSRATGALAPVDIDPSLQRLAGSVARQQPEAGNIGLAFQAARQTGQPPGLPLSRTANIEVRSPFAPVTPDARPAGQFERVADSLRRALQIQDHRLHGMGRSAHETENIIVNRARQQAQQLYGNAYKAAQGVDIRPHVQPVIDKWTAAMADEPVAVANAMRQFLRQFQTAQGTVPSLVRFQKAKEFGDGLIRKWLKSPESQNRYVGGRLTEMQRELLEAADNIPGAGQLYREAREAFADEARMRSALQLGRDVFREDAEVAVTQYRALSSEGERKMFRMGLLDGFNQKAGRSKRTADVTQIFETPRMQEILREVIPRSQGRAAAFADRPERFGQFVANEKRMISTRNETLGNSKTAERLQDDEALSEMQSLASEAIKSGASPAGFVMRVVERSLERLFGFRADTASAIAQKLYTASPMERERLLSELERRLGPTRSAQFARLMREAQQAAGVGAAISASGTAAQP